MLCRLAKHCDPVTGPRWAFPALEAEDKETDKAATMLQETADIKVELYGKLYGSLSAACEKKRLVLTRNLNNCGAVLENRIGTRPRPVACLNPLITLRFTNFCG